MNKPQLDNRAQRVARALRFLTFAGFPLLLVALALFFGCNSSLSTYRAASSSTMVTGMAYYLPVGKITVKGEFAPQPPPAASASPTTSPEKGAKKDSGRGDATENLAAIPAESPAKEGADAGGKPAAANGAAGAQTISVGGLTLTLSSDVEADTNGGRYAVHVRNAMFEDEIKLTVNPKHLLSAGKATTEDKTAEIVGTVAQLAKAAATGPGFLKVQGTPAPTPIPRHRQPFYISFYPSSPKACDYVQEQLGERNIEFTITSEAAAVTNDMPKGKPANPQQGLVFRFAKIYKVRIRYPVGDKVWNESDSKDLILLDTTAKFVLPDTTRDYVFAYPRLALVKAVNEVGFTDGMLTDLHLTRPSLIVGILSVPKAIAQAIIPGFPAPTSSGSSAAAGAPAAAKN